MSKLLKAFLPLAALVAAGCMKEPELKADFGPEVTAAEFSRKLAEIEGPDPYTIKKNEYAYFIRSTVLQDQIYQLDKRWAYTVTNKAEDANDYIFTFVKETREYVGDQEKISQNQSDVRLTKRASTSAAAASVTSAPLTPFAVASLTPFAYRPAATEKVTFHNLNLETTHVPVPDFVQQRANCGGLSNEKCRGALKAYVLTFDQVQWQGNEGQRFSVLWIFSPDVPYFGSTMFPSPAGVLKSCGTTQIPFDGQRVKVTQCDEIKDFTFGSD